MPTVGPSTLLGLNATDYAVVTSISEGETSGHDRGNDYLVVIECGNAQALTGDRRCLDKQVVGSLVPYADGKGRLGKTNVNGCLHAHVGEIVRNVNTVLVLTAYNKVLEKAVAGKALGGSRVAHLVEIVELYPDAVKIFLRGSKSFLATVNILFEEGIHILVKASGRDRVSARLTLEKLLNEPECLTSLVE